jgi:hypothetical protein
MPFEVTRVDPASKQQLRRHILFEASSACTTRFKRHVPQSPKPRLAG